MSSIATSDTEAGLPGGQLQGPRFSLYSTDTEEQVASVNRGLDRCAALLKSLLSPEKASDVSSQQQKTQVDLKQQHDGGQQLLQFGEPENNNRGKSLSVKLTSKTVRNNLSLANTNQLYTEHPQDIPRFPGDSRRKHTHPHASSTPIPQRDRKHLRSITEPRETQLSKETPNLVQSQAQAKKPKQLDNHPLLPGGITTQANSTKKAGEKAAPSVQLREVGNKRKAKKAHRRLQTAPGKPLIAFNRNQKQTTSREQTKHHQHTISRPVTTTVHPKPAIEINSKSEPQVTSNPTSFPHHPFGYTFPPPFPYYSPYLPSSTSSPWSHVLSTGREIHTNKAGVLPPQPYPPYYPTPVINGWYPMQYNGDGHSSGPPISTQAHNAGQTAAPSVATSMPLTTAAFYDPNLITTFPSTFTSTTTGPLMTSAYSKMEHGLGGRSSVSVATLPSSTHPTTVTTTSVPSVHRVAPVSAAVRDKLHTDDRQSHTPHTSEKNSQKRCSSAPLTRHSILSHGEAEVGECAPGKTRRMLEEMQRSLVESITQIQQGCQVADHTVLVTQLDQLKTTLSVFCGQLHQESQQLPKDSVLSSPPLSTTHWLQQIQLLETENSRLLQRIVASESAYSEVMGQLEQVRKEKSSFHIQVETRRKELDSLREDLQSAKDTLALMESHSTVTKEEYSEMKSTAAAYSKQVEYENEELKDSVKCLERELAKSKRESSSFMGQLLVVKSSLDTAQEELQMIRVTIAEKDTQLLQAQDQFLGLRQCLAYFLSKLRRVDSCKSCDHHVLGTCYVVPLEIVEQLHSLVNDGNVDRFLSECSKGQNDSQSSTNQDRSTESDTTLVETRTKDISKSNEGQGNELDLSMNTSDGSDIQQGPPTLSSASNPVITPLNISGLENVSALQMTQSVDLGDNGVSMEYSSQSLSTLSCSSSTQVSSPLEQTGKRSLRRSVLKAHHTPSDHSQQSFPLTRKDVSYGKGSSPQTSVTSRGIDAQSSVTTSSEVEFRKDLASLDADIARLQIQFRVALQTSP